jgi:hypothetical protein
MKIPPFSEGYSHWRVWRRSVDEAREGMPPCKVSLAKVANAVADPQIIEAIALLQAAAAGKATPAQASRWESLVGMPSVFKRIAEQARAGTLRLAKLEIAKTPSGSWLVYEYPLPGATPTTTPPAAVAAKAADRLPPAEKLSLYQRMPEGTERAEFFRRHREELFYAAKT